MIDRPAHPAPVNIVNDELAGVTLKIVRIRAGVRREQIFRFDSEQGQPERRIQKSSKPTAPEVAR